MQNQHNVQEPVMPDKIEVSNKNKGPITTTRNNKQLIQQQIDAARKRGKFEKKLREEKDHRKALQTLENELAQSKMLKEKELEKHIEEMKLKEQDKLEKFKHHEHEKIEKLKNEVQEKSKKVDDLIEKKVQEKVSQKKVNQECFICYDREADTAVVPCGHASLCYVCATEYETNHKSKGCPMCRGPIEKIIKLYK
jgi:predicted  nucleic acid-binding Zn-ribbon protein